MVSTSFRVLAALFMQGETNGTNTEKTRRYGHRQRQKLLLQLMIPAVVAQIVNLLYNIVDRIYIGHIPGTAQPR